MFVNKNYKYFKEYKLKSLNDDEIDWKIEQLLREKEEREKRKLKREKDFEM